MERRRREREEALKREKEEAERQEQMERELEENRMKREEELRFYFIYLLLVTVINMQKILSNMKNALTRFTFLKVDTKFQNVSVIIVLLYENKLCS